MENSIKLFSHFTQDVKWISLRWPIFSLNLQDNFCECHLGVIDQANAFITVNFDLLYVCEWMRLQNSVIGIDKVEMVR